MVPGVLLVGDVMSFVQAVVVLPCKIFSMRIIPNAESDGGFGLGTSSVVAYILTMGIL